VTAATEIVGVLLAGGLARRMGGGDKSMAQVGGQPILERIIDRVRPQVGPLILNANGDAGRFQAYGLPVVADTVEGFAGPLAGVLTALEWAAEHAPGCHWVASFATDAPFLPTDLVARLSAAIADERAELACARSDGRAHPVFGLWPVELAAELRRALVDEEMRKIDRWTERYRLVHVDFETQPVDPFFNVNRPENLTEAENLARRLDGGDDDVRGVA